MDTQAGGHILLVEDDEVLLRGMHDLLKLEGFSVTTAVDGADGLRVLESMMEFPDLIISDIRMPHMDGYEFLAAVRGRPEWLMIPFIFLSAKGQKEDIRYGKMRGVDDYIPKPFDFKDLIVSVKAAIQRRQELAEWQEIRMESLKQRILTVLHHEFRTPLSYIVAYADLMASSSSFSNSTELRQYIGGIMEGSERLSNLIESFLILAELESGYGKKIIERRRTIIDDVPALVRQMIDNLKEKADDRDVVIDLEVGRGIPKLQGDEVYIGSAIKHLVDNAIKFSTRNVRAKVHVNIDSQDGYVVISVIDEGPGVPLEEQQKLFQSFYQINREKNEQQGAGSGLAIARHVAMLHNGRVEVESDEGLGSCFRLRLPGIDAVRTPEGNGHRN
jgi:two-component system, sensor histidine kinase and response regulator